MIRSVAAFLAIALLGAASPTSGTGVVGAWREPGGSVIEVAACSAGLCATLVTLSRSSPEQVDAKNPNPALRGRQLCGLKIGYGFRLADAAHANGGTLYDPKSGKTYHGMMSAEGDTLHLRGYVGLKAFGRTQDWSRTSAPSNHCSI